MNKKQTAFSTTSLNQLQYLAAKPNTAIRKIKDIEEVIKREGGGISENRMELILS